MKVEQLYTGCLAQGAYYIESNGEAAIIDPLREVDQYIEMAKERGAKIKYVFETHFHADFVSGHVDLSKKTGAPIIYGPTEMETGFDAHIGHDGEQFPLGNAMITMLHTPGHTMESSCYLLTDENGKDTSIFTGDTLFIGDVGRPDLAQHVVADLTQEKLAGHLFDSLRNKIMPLSDDITVYPGHGAGSACGKNMSDETFDTLGNQKKTNYALRADMTKDEFIKELITGLAAPPGYFPNNVLMNIKGYDSIDNVIDRGLKPLGPNEFEAAQAETDAVVIDTRDKDEFVKGFIPGSYFIGIDGNFAVWVGTLISDIKQKILLVGDENRIPEVVTRLARVGYDHAIGYLKGGVEAWAEAGKDMETIESISVTKFAERMANVGEVKVVDVRKKSEYDSEHIVHALNAPLDHVSESMTQLNKNDEYLVHCATGYRSLAFISILRSKGYSDLINVEGGFDAIKKSGKFELTEYVCPTSML